MPASTPDTAITELCRQCNTSTEGIIHALNEACVNKNPGELNQILNDSLTGSPPKTTQIAGLPPQTSADGFPQVAQPLTVAAQHKAWRDAELAKICTALGLNESIVTTFAKYVEDVAGPVAQTTLQICKFICEEGPKLVNTEIEKANEVLKKIRLPTTEQISLAALTFLATKFLTGLAFPTNDPFITPVIIAGVTVFLFTVGTTAFCQLTKVLLPLVAEGEI